MVVFLIIIKDIQDIVYDLESFGIDLFIIK